MFGEAKAYNRFKGCGWIVPLDQSLPDHFVSYRSIRGTKYDRYLIVGQTVEFTSVMNDQGPQAIDVRKIPITVARQTSVTR